MTDRTVRAIGEFGLIAALRDALPPATIAGDRLQLGIGDDAAVWTPAAGESLVITTDSLIEGIHFRLVWTDWRSLGWKSLTVNISDIAAMGAAPAMATLSIGLRGSELVDDLREFYRGVGAAAERYGVLIAGGDIVASPDAFSVHVTAFGESRGGRWLTRSGARPGDLIAVSGSLGASAAGHRLLRDGGPARSAATASLLIAEHLRPTPRVELGALLLELGATSTMDLSDGLFGDLPKILTASGVGASVDAERVPIPAAVRALFPGDWFDLATRGGEDYELLFTIPPSAFEELKARAAEVGSTVTAIGEILDGPCSLTLRHANGASEAVHSGAFDHFS